LNRLLSSSFEERAGGNKVLGMDELLYEKLLTAESPSLKTKYMEYVRDTHLSGLYKSPFLILAVKYMDGRTMPRDWHDRLSQTARTRVIWKHGRGEYLEGFGLSISIRLVRKMRIYVVLWKGYI